MWVLDLPHSLCVLATTKEANLSPSFRTLVSLGPSGVSTSFPPRPSPLSSTTGVSAQSLHERPWTNSHSMDPHCMRCGRQQGHRQLRSTQQQCAGPDGSSIVWPARHCSCMLFQRQHLQLSVTSLSLSSSNLWVMVVMLCTLAAATGWASLFVAQRGQIPYPVT